jgi:alpha-beta hydrolase superfamily lysophospholipase
MTLNDLTVYRNHPLDNISKLTENKIPVILVAGDSDSVVPYDENGIFVKDAYEKTDIPFKVIVKPGCDHHPHGLEDPTEIVEFIEANY